MVKKCLSAEAREAGLPRIDAMNEPFLAPGEQPMTQAQRRSMLQRITFYGAVFLALLGLYEPSKDIYTRFVNPDIGDGSVALQLEQQRVQERNLECFLERTPYDVKLETETRVRLLACKTGDVQVTVYPPALQAKQVWIPFAELKSGSASLEFLFGKAFAAQPFPDGRLHLTQVAVQSVCQAWQDETRRSKLIRITNEGGKCFKEIINVFTGAIEYREETPCNAPCK
jgi:hypothetical protein